MYDEHPYIKKAYRLSNERLGRRKHPLLDISRFEHTLNVYFDVYRFESRVSLRAAALLFEVLRSGNTDFKELSDVCGHDVALIVQELFYETRRMEDDERLEYMIKKANSMSEAAFLIYLADIKNIVLRLEAVKNEAVSSFLWETREVLHALKDKRGEKYPERELLKQIYLRLSDLGYGSV